MIDYNRVLEVVRKTPEANSELGLALAFVEAGDVILGALHAAAAADLLASKYAGEFDPIKLGQLLQASLVESSVAADRAHLN